MPERIEMDYYRYIERNKRKELHNTIKCVYNYDENSR